MAARSSPRRPGPALMLVAAALLIVFLAENARIPVDDPNTHLELTMIHEVMVLDHSGPDLAMIQYGAMLKLWVLRLAAGRHVWCRCAAVVVPGRSGRWAWRDMAVLAVLVGRDRIDDGPAAAGPRAAVPGRGLGAVDPGPGYAGDEVDA